MEKRYSDLILEILACTPKNVLDIGGGTGELVRFLEEEGINAVCMDNSEKCWNNRVTDSFVLHDALETPWPFKDKQFDLCTGFGFLKYVPEQKIEALFHEIARVTQKGFFGVGRGIRGSPSERIELEKSTDWWIAKFNEIILSYPVEVFYMRYRSSLGV